MLRVHQTATVPPDCAGQRLDKVAARLFASFSRVELTQWINQGDLTVDGRALKPKTRVFGGEQLTLSCVRTDRESWHDAQPIPLNVLYEDPHLLVVDKPAGLVVHPGAGNASGTLVNGLLHHRPSLAELPRAGVVHRLDKDTSGVMLVAGSLVSQRRLTGMIGAREVRRCYLAVAEGRMVAGRDVDAPIGRDPHVRTRQAVRDDGKSAFTAFRVRERFRAHTLLLAELGTGRTHQIRVHLKSIGFPLVGDRRYGARGLVPAGADPALIEVLHTFPRQALHAWQLELQHPVGGEELKFEAPLPDDLRALIAALEADHAPPT